MIGPDTTLVDCEVGGGADGEAHGCDALGDRRRGIRRPVLVPAPRHRARRRRQDRHLRRDEERDDRRGQQGAAPLVRRRRRRSASTRTSAPASIFANYDGVRKHHSEVGSHVRTGSHGVFVAPVRIGDGAYTGAGTVVRKDVPAGALAVNVAPQRNIDGWVQTHRPGTAAAQAAEAQARHPASTTTRLTHRLTRAERRPHVGNQDHRTEAPRARVRASAPRSSPSRSPSELGSELVPTDARTFANGEIYARYDESVRGCDAFVIQSHTSPINEWLMEQLIMVDALKRASAKRITVVVAVLPLRPPGQEGPRPRADLRPPRRRPVQGRRRRPHHDRRPARRADPGLLRRPRRPPVRHARAARALPQKLDPETLTVVSPDMGRVRVADIWSDKLGAPLAIIHKRRDPLVPNQVSVHEIVGEVDGRVCLLVDDLIDTGRTIVKAAEALKAERRHRRRRRRHSRGVRDPAVEHPAERRRSTASSSPTRCRSPRRSGSGQPHGAADRAAARARHPRGLRRRLGHDRCSTARPRPAMAITTPRPWLASYAEGVPHDIELPPGSLYDLVRGSVAAVRRPRRARVLRAHDHLRRARRPDRPRRRGPAPARRAEGRPGGARAAELPAAHRRVLRGAAPRRDRRRAQPALHAARAAPPVRGPRRAAS